MKLQPITFNTPIPFIATNIEGRVINYSLNEGDILTYFELTSDDGRKESQNLIITKEELEDLSTIVNSTLKSFFEQLLNISFIEGSKIIPKEINSLSDTFIAEHCDIIIRWYNLFSPENTKILIIFRNEISEDSEDSEEKVKTFSQELDIPESSLETLTTSTGDPFLVRPILREVFRLKLQETISKDITFINEEE